MKKKKVVLSYGFGVDSTAAVLRWLAEPDTRPFADWSDLVVISAQTGSEWEETGRLVEAFIYPLLAQHGIRTVQVARKTKSQTDGIVVLDDTTAPKLCHIRPTPERPYYRLADEMFENGTIPQSGGIRKCSIKAKGVPIDAWVGPHTGGEDFLHVIGYEANETGRMVKDMGMGTVPGRIPAYPLIDWGWDRETCLQYILLQTGVLWSKSACCFCPFAFAEYDGSRERTIRRYIASPHEAMEPLLMEYAAVTLNHRQGLVGGKRLADLLAAHPDSAEIMAMFAAVLEEEEWAVYDVRRAIAPSEADRAKPRKNGNVRYLEKLTSGGTRSEALARLEELASKHGTRVQRDRGHHRVWLAERDAYMYYPARERALVIAPARAVDKVNTQFADIWESAKDTPMNLSLV